MAAVLSRFASRGLLIRAVFVGLCLLGCAARAQTLSCYHPQGHHWLQPFGDLNGSGSVNVADALCAVLVSLSPEPANPPSCLAAPSGRVAVDLNCDGATNVSDVVLGVVLALSGELASSVPVDSAGCPVACTPCAEPGAASCLVTGTCVPEGDSSPIQPCLACIPGANAAAYTPLPNGSPCGAGLACAQGLCALQVPAPPTILSAQGASGSLTVTVQANAAGGAPTSYTVTAQPGGASASGPGPVVLSGLTAGQAYVLTAVASNAAGTSGESAPFGPVFANTPESCWHVLQLDPSAPSGSYVVDPGGNGAFEVYCDMTGDSGGWALVEVGLNNNSADLRTNGPVGAVTHPSQPSSGKLSRARVADLFGGTGAVRYGSTTYGYLFLQGFSDAQVRVGYGSVGYGTPIRPNTVAATFQGPGHAGTRLDWPPNSRPEACLNSDGTAGECGGGLHWGNWAAHGLDGAYMNHSSLGAGPMSLAPYTIWVRWGGPRPTPPRSCTHLREIDPAAPSGLYTVDPTGADAFDTYCDMATDGGGWTLVELGNANASADLRTASAVGTVVSPAQPASAKLSRARMADLYDTTGSLRYGSSSYGYLYIKGLSDSEVRNGFGSVGYGTPVRPHSVAASFGGTTYGGSLVDWPSQGRPEVCLNSNGSTGECSTGLHWGNWGGNSVDGAYMNGSSFHSGTVNPAPYSLWIRSATYGSHPGLAGESCYDILLSGGSTGDGVYWIDPSGNDPFQAYCDMTAHGGGYTLLALGESFYGNVQVPTLTNPAAPGTQVLSQSRAEALVAASTGLFRLANGALSQAMFIDDAAPLYSSGLYGGYGFGHVWSTNAPSLKCATSYSQVQNNTMVTTSTFQINCEPKAPGVHTCGITSGWILFHVGGTFNYDGNHPCPFGVGQSTGLSRRWVR